jgi:hypothetical protein
LEKRGIRIALGTAALLPVEPPPPPLHKRDDAREVDAIGDELWSFVSRVLVLFAPEFLYEI